MSRNMDRFSSLPAELIIQIYSYLIRYSSRVSLIKTCRRFYTLLEDELYKHSGEVKWLPVHFGARTNNVGMIKRCFELGAPLNNRFTYLKDIRDFVDSDCSSWAGVQTPAEVAISNGHFAAFEYLLTFSDSSDSFPLVNFLLDGCTHGEIMQEEQMLAHKEWEDGGSRNRMLRLLLAENQKVRARNPEIGYRRSMESLWYFLSSPVPYWPPCKTATATGFSGALKLFLQLEATGEKLCSILCDCPRCNGIPSVLDGTLILFPKWPAALSIAALNCLIEVEGLCQALSAQLQGIRHEIIAADFRSRIQARDPSAYRKGRVQKYNSVRARRR
ncbi:hypothetical protein GQ53DRAFT_806444 [Thozetella sp. PMI_491]|nr:hypothetical protein GQ53DRAFT_806444 [Thozetella sp. PMI_491]